MPRFMVDIVRIIETSCIIEAATLAEARKLASAFEDRDITQDEIENGGWSRVEDVRRERES